MSEPIIYEASVYTRTVRYKNFLGEIVDVELYFSLDPLELMELISTFQPKKIKSGNPARNGVEEVTDEQQLKFVRNIAARSAGFISNDGESFDPFEDFGESLAGKAFLTKLTSSDGDRKEFAEMVILAPFRAFVGFAKADPSNDASDIAQFEKSLREMENVFKVPEKSLETPAEARERLKAELALVGDDE